MRIIGIVGSPRKMKGNTGRLMMEVLKGAETEGATFETIALPGGTVLPCDEFTSEIVEKAHALGRKLVSNWRKKIIPPDVERRKAQFAERMRQLMLYRKTEWPFEYEYWKKTRGL